jgi:hypothetical protein
MDDDERFRLALVKAASSERPIFIDRFRHPIQYLQMKKDDDRPFLACAIEGCEKPRKGTDRLCSAHAHKRSRYGDPLAKRQPRPVLVCSVEGCGRARCAKGLCKLHWGRRKRGMPLDLPVRTEVSRVGPCLVEGCERRRNARGYCATHYVRLVKHGDPLVVTRFAPRGWWKDSAGYCYRTVSADHPGSRFMLAHGKRSTSSNIIAVHRDEMQKMLGRPLFKGENVHHINGIRDDNRPENLELWVSSQPSGQRVKDCLTWAREIIARYGDLVEQASIARNPNERRGKKTSNGR